MFSVNNFYAYLQRKYTGLEKNNLFYAFSVNGSRNIYDISPFVDKSTDDYQSNVASKNITHYYGCITALDQEPINKDQLFCDYSELFARNPNSFGSSTEWTNHYSALDVMAQRLSKVHTSVICHSEKRSDEVDYLRSLGFIDVHYWYHGLIARDWFRHWKHYDVTTSDFAHRLGCYIRDTTGTREYRKGVLDLVRQENIYCPALENKMYDSDASAMLEWSDTELFDIQIVAETLFHTSKTHLTEKVLKPVAMQQPFILFAGPHSLEYMKSYGFQTFSSCWDESYDNITNSAERYHAVSEIIKHLNNLPEDQYKRIINRARLIALGNREHFFSQQFENVLMHELHTNMSQALQQQKENFFADPGGMFFRVANELKTFSNDSFPKWLLHDAPYVLKHIQLEYPEVAKQILRKYPDLF